MLMANQNQGSRWGHTLAHLLLAFSIKLELPRYKIAHEQRKMDRQLMGFQHCST